MLKRQASGCDEVSAGGRNFSHSGPQDGDLTRSKRLPGTERPSRNWLGKGGQVRISVWGLGDHMCRVLEQ